LGDFLYQPARRYVISSARDACLRDDADEPTVILDQGKTANLMLGLHSQRFVHILLRIRTSTTARLTTSSRIIFARYATCC
jgi:hypothetical protein